MTERGEDRLSHIDATGRARMVDVGDKHVTVREAMARGSVRMLPATLDLIRDDAAAKGDVLGVARIAAIMAAKRTSDLIPLCHGLPISVIEIEFSFDEQAGRLDITAWAKAESRTGVEMEALTAVAVAGLTVYDMCKAVDRGMVIEGIRVVSKSGGRSGIFRAD